MTLRSKAAVKKRGETVTYPDPGLCSGCGVVFEHGRFKWKLPPPEQARPIVCPACRAQREEYARGLLRVRGAQLQALEPEIQALVEKVAAYESQHHPLERILAVVRLDDELEICTTYEYLARRLAETLHQAWHGDMHYAYTYYDQRLTIVWEPAPPS